MDAEDIRVSSQAKTGFRNIYTLPNEAVTSVEMDIDKALARQTSEDDIHPSPADRFRLVRNVRSDGSRSANKPVWDLFPDPQAVTQEMTTEIESKVKGELALRYPTLVNASSVLVSKFAPRFGRIDARTQRQSPTLSGPRCPG